MSKICSGCGKESLLIFHEMLNVPVHCTALMSTRREALNSPRGDIILGFCEKCGLITNVAFDPAIQNNSVSYEDQQCYSPTFNAYGQKLAEHLIKKYNLYGRDIVEIGCGKGDFLSLLCELGDNRGVGIDPLSNGNRLDNKISNNLTFIQDYYSEDHGRYHSDLLVCRHTLEHIHHPAQFIHSVRRSIGNRLDTIVLFEVPDVARILRELAFWDIHYEHCSYYSIVSLSRLFCLSCFEVIELSAAYADQYLLIEAQPIEIPSSTFLEQQQSVEEIAQDVNYFTSHINNMFSQWRQFIHKQCDQGKRLVIWGAGSKCVSFLATLGIEDKIECVIDINPNRQGKFLPGSGIEIMAPEFLKEYKPDLVIIMNSIYESEIHQMINKMRVTTDVIAL